MASLFRWKLYSSALIVFEFPPPGGSSLFVVAVAQLYSLPGGNSKVKAGGGGYSINLPRGGGRPPGGWMMPVKNTASRTHNRDTYNTGYGLFIVHRKIDDGLTRNTRRPMYRSRTNARGGQTRQRLSPEARKHTDASHGDVKPTASSAFAGK